MSLAIATSHTNLLSGLRRQAAGQHANQVRQMQIARRAAAAVEDSGDDEDGEFAIGGFEEIAPEIEFETSDDVNESDDREAREEAYEGHNRRQGKRQPSRLMVAALDILA
jgi:hypothetical protein